MKVISVLLKALCVLLMAAVIAVCVPSPAVWAEEPDASLLPVFEPVTLAGGCGKLPLEGVAPYAAPKENYSADGMNYLDDSLSVQIREFRVWDTTVLAARVQVASPTQLRTEQAARYPNQNSMLAIQMARRAKAVIAVNADYFIYHSQGIVYRAGKLLRNRPSEEFDGLIVDKNGDFHLSIPIRAEDYENLDILCSFAFGPALVKDGEIWDNTDRKVTYKSRVGVAQLAPLTYLLLVCDGDSPGDEESNGLSIQQFSELFKAMGAVTAYNLDGGVSATMVFGGSKINGNVRHGRNVGDILYFATAVPDK